MMLGNKEAVVIAILLIVAGALAGVIGITMAYQPYFDKAEDAINSCVDQLITCQGGIIDPENLEIDPIVS